jgi:1,4-dihydroxy-2-naphthoyl-CoA hydrolase
MSSDNDNDSDNGLGVGSFVEHLGLTLTQASGDEVLGRVVITPALHQPYGVVHGGVYCSLVETVASVGAALWFGERGRVVGVANHTNFLRAVREGALDVRALPIQRGRTQQLWTVDITDERDRLIAKGDVRLANLASSHSIGGPSAADSVAQRS